MVALCTCKKYEKLYEVAKEVFKEYQKTKTIAKNCPRFSIERMESPFSVWNKINFAHH